MHFNLSNDIPDFGTPGNPGQPMGLYTDYVYIRLQLYLLMKRLHPEMPAEDLETKVRDAEAFIIAADFEDDVLFEPDAPA